MATTIASPVRPERWCKSWLFTRWPSDPPFVNLRATLLDDPILIAEYRANGAKP